MRRLLVLPPLLLLAACLPEARSSLPDGPAAPAEAAPRPVQVAVIRHLPGDSGPALTGTLRARREADVAFRAGGRIAERLVDLGAEVEAGQPLFRLDTRDLRLALAAAETDVLAAGAGAGNAANEAARSRSLLAADHVAAAFHEARETTARAAAQRLASARAQRDLARNRLDYAELRAPATGRVTAILGEAGQVVSDGPPVPFPVAFRLVGPDVEELRRQADAMTALLRQVPGTRGVQTDWSERGPALRLELELERIAQLGLSPAAVATSMGSLPSGVAATQLREVTRAVEVRLRATGEERASLDRLADLTLATPAGVVPLGQVARLVPVMEEPILWRRNREPFITLRSDIAPGLQAPDVTAAALPALAPFAAALPPGYRMEVAGAAGESGKANASLFALFPVVVAVMLALLMLQLRHLGDTALVMATAPLGIPGAAAALLLMHAPFGFVALLGVIALAGMVMRNTLILVDQVRQDRAAGLSRREAIIESTARRARPVVLTALAAIFAFIPLTTSVFWGPMAIAMIGGLLVATVATLFIVPALSALVLRKPRPESTAPIPKTVLEPAK